MTAREIPLCRGVKPLAPACLCLTSLLSARVITETELQFDGWTVNRISGEMARNGSASRLNQQPLRILLELADHSGEVVTREQLVKALWPRGIIDFDNGLNVAVRKLRVALDDVGDTPRYIETLPRVGYRFIGLRGAPPEPSTSMRCSRRCGVRASSRPWSCRRRPTMRECCIARVAMTRRSQC